MPKRKTSKMIPKTIHYIWFGKGKIPPLQVKCIDSWKRIMPDYEIREWNDQNFDTTINPWMDKMHREGQYSFASDYARLHILDQHGGIYLDTDMEVKKRLDRFLDCEAFFGFAYDCYFATCLIGGVKGNPIFGELLQDYDNPKGQILNNSFVTNYFLRKFPEFRLNNRNQIVGDRVHIYAKEYFCLPGLDPRKNYCRHHAANFWNKNRNESTPLKRAVRLIIGETLFFKLVAYKVRQINQEFGPIYKSHCKK